MKLRNILIPVVASMIVVGTTSAFSPKMIEKLTVSEDVKEVLVEAHEMKEAGSTREEVKEYLESEGITSEVRKGIKEEMKEVRKIHWAEVSDALESKDYGAFQAATSEGKLSQNITTEADFLRLAEAHELRIDGDKEGAKEIMKELGIEHKGKRGHKKESRSSRPAQAK